MLPRCRQAPGGVLPGEGQWQRIVVGLNCDRVGGTHRQGVGQLAGVPVVGVPEAHGRGCHQQYPDNNGSQVPEAARRRGPVVGVRFGVGGHCLVPLPSPNFPARNGLYSRVIV